MCVRVYILYVCMYVCAYTIRIYTLVLYTHTILYLTYMCIQSSRGVQSYPKEAEGRNRRAQGYHLPP